MIENANYYALKYKEAQLWKATWVSSSDQTQKLKTKYTSLWGHLEGYLSTAEKNMKAQKEDGFQLTTSIWHYQ